MLADRFAASFRHHFPDILGGPVLVALSGGADSVALTHLLVRTGAVLDVTVAAAHVHHHLRGAAADADAAFCAALCRRLGVTCRTADIDPEPPRRRSPESWWREQRYAALEQLRRELGCSAIATGHTLDDQAETVLLKLFRGAGPRAAAGIRRRRGAVIRPLLDMRRAEVRSWLDDLGEGWREDASNASEDRPRTWIRHRLLPLVDGAYPNVAARLGAFADALDETEAFVGDELRRRASWPRPGHPVELAPVRDLPRPLRLRWLLELAGSLPLTEPPSRVQLEAGDAMIVAGTPAAVDLGRRWVIRRRGSRLVLSPPPVPPFGSVPAGEETALPGGFVGRLRPLGRGHSALLAARLVKLDPTWRSARAGDTLAGRSVRTSLAAHGVPAEWRRAWPVLEAGGRMVWVPAVGVAHGWEGEVGSGVTVELEEPWGRFAKS